MASDMIMASQTAAMEGASCCRTHYVCSPEKIIHAFLQMIKKNN